MTAEQREPWRKRLRGSETAVWDRTVQDEFQPAELDILMHYCRHTAKSDELTELARKWDEMDPTSELGTLLQMRQREASAAASLAKLLGLVR